MWYIMLYMRERGQYGELAKQKKERGQYGKLAAKYEKFKDILLELTKLADVQPSTLDVLNRYKFQT